MANQVAEPRYGRRCFMLQHLLHVISRSLRLSTIWLLCAWAVVGVDAKAIQAQEIWEFSPYRVQLWLSIDPALAISPAATKRFKEDLVRQLDLAFGATWNTKLDDAPPLLRYPILHDIESIQPSMLNAGDYVLILAKKNEATDSVRALESFVDKGFDVMISRKGYDQAMERLIPDSSATAFTTLRGLLKSEPKTSLQLLEAISKDEIPAALISKIEMQLKADELRLITSIGDYALVVPRKNAATKDVENLETFNDLGISVSTPQDKFEMLSKRLKEDAITRLKAQIRPTDKPSSLLAAEVAQGTIPAAIVLKDDFARQAENTRSIVVKFSNQSDAFLDRHDKLFFIGLKMASHGPTLEVRELDCPTRRLSNVYRRDLYHPTQLLAAPVAGLIRDCFTPIARIEESDPTSVKMRGRAAGLITSSEHPALMRAGDVLQVVVRRNDRNGQPSLLETVPWTFVVATAVRGEHIDGTVFSGVRGGLEGRRNSRTQRIAMLVKPQGTKTDLLVVTQNAKDKPLAATQIFQRLPGGDKSDPIGRTDWRGQLRLPMLAEPPIATIKITKPVAPVTADNANPATNEVTAAAAAPAAEVATEQIEIPLRSPLMIYYVKNGETLLARLPIVIGLSPIVTAEVLDDSRRLQAEGFLRGLQSEVVDVVALRQVTAARVRMRIEERKLEDAGKLLEELRQLKDYDKMVGELDTVQRQVLDPAAGAITPVAQIRIEKMFQQTRELLQKYLQNDLLKKVEKELDVAIKGGEMPAEPETTPAPSPAATAGPTPQPVTPQPVTPQPVTPQPPTSGQSAPPGPTAEGMQPTAPGVSSAPPLGAPPGTTPNAEAPPMRKNVPRGANEAPGAGPPNP
jgi:hypothetical protein